MGVDVASVMIMIPSSPLNICHICHLKHPVWTTRKPEPLTWKMGVAGARGRAQQAPGDPAISTTRMLGIKAPQTGIGGHLPACLAAMLWSRMRSRFWKTPELLESIGCQRRRTWDWRGGIRAR